MFSAFVRRNLAVFAGYMVVTLRTWTILACLSGSVVNGQNAAPQPSIWDSTKDVASFERVETQRLDRAQKAIAALVSVKGKRTVDNTAEPFDEAVRELNNAAYLAEFVQEAHPDGDYRDHATAMKSKADAAILALQLNRDVYRALASLDLTAADSPTKFYVQRRLLFAKLAGVDKDDTTRERIAKLREELSLAESAFARNMNADLREVLADPADLEGMAPDFIAQHKPGPDGKVHLSADAPIASPVFAYASNEGLRRRMFMAWDSKGYPANHDVLLHTLQLRFEIARLMGYSDWVDYHTAPRMARNAAVVQQFIQDFEAVVWPVAQREYAIFLEEKKKIHPEAADLSEDEVSYYAERALRSRYNFDSKVLREYLPFGVVKQGLLDVAARLFRVTFRQEKDFLGWDPAIESWEVLDSDGHTMIGRFYLDLHPRPGKYVGFMNAHLLDGKLGKQLPETVLLCNLPRPSGTDAGLLTLSEATQFFHEFGHTMHKMVGYHQRWSGNTTRNMEQDFVEVPSQFFELWPSDPNVLATFARHYRTGKPIPAELLAAYRRASAFGRGYGWLWMNAYAAIAFDLHHGDPKAIDIETVSPQAIQRYLHVEPVPNTHAYASFDQLLEPYTDYYIYPWDQVIAVDFFSQFNPDDLFAGNAPLRYRRAVLEPFGSMSANDLVKNFLSRPQNMDAFQRWLNEEFESPARQGLGVQ